MYGLHHLKEIFIAKDKIKYTRESQLESQLQAMVKTFQLHMLKRKIIKY